MKSGWQTLWFLPMAFLWMGCTTTTAQVCWSREMQTRIEPHEAFSIAISHEAGTVVEAVGCISGAIRRTFPAVRIVPTEEFHRTAFPDLTPEQPPHTSKSLSLLFEDPAFRARIAPLGLRYLISIQGKTVQEGKPFAGAVGGAGVLVLGAEWDRKTHLTAAVLDLTQNRAAGEVKATASGSPWFALIFAPFPFPIGAPAFTESKACKEMGEGVVKFLAGENSPDMQKEQAVLLYHAIHPLPESLIKEIELVEKQAVVDALAKTGDNVTRAAKALGVSRATLQNKMKLYGLRGSGEGENTGRL